MHGAVILLKLLSWHYSADSVRFVLPNPPRQVGQLYKEVMFFVQEKVFFPVMHYAW